MLFIGAYLLFFIRVDNCSNQLFVSERVKIMEKTQINQQQYLFYCFPPCISVKKTVCLEWDMLPVQKPSRVWVLLFPGSSVTETGKRHWVVGLFVFFFS